MVHIDCDAFYAAVEELDHPELKHVPMAVGKGVLTTCNYHARKFGCRSGMAGFVAMKLCPELICLPLNFEKYTAKAQEVRQVLARYDPRFESASIDEAYLNITEYCIEHGQDAEEIVSQLRAEVFEHAKITVSAGIAANAKLAKISSNMNKPNGQFRLANERSAIMAFMRNLPTRKVNGIGRVFERELDAIGVKTCGDIYAHRSVLAKLFGEKAFQFLMTCYLGLGRTKIQPAEDYERKSVGTESTFRDMSSKVELREKLRHIAEELEKDLKRTQFKGRTLVLKIKLHTYEVLTRQVAPPKAVHLADDLYKYALPMLSKLEKEIPGMTLRLMGLRMTHLVSMSKGGINFFGLGKDAGIVNRVTKRDDDGWEIWPDTEFEDAARQERQDEMNEVWALSQEAEQQPQDTPPSPRRKHGREILPNPAPCPSSGPPPLPPLAAEETTWRCPVCSRPQPADDRAFNSHIDLCLSRQTILEAVEETSSPASGGSGGTQTDNNTTTSTTTVTTTSASLSSSSIPSSLLHRQNSNSTSAQSKKRGRPSSNVADGGNNVGGGGGGAQKKLFFHVA